MVIITLTNKSTGQARVDIMDAFAQLDGYLSSYRNVFVTHHKGKGQLIVRADAPILGEQFPSALMGDCLAYSIFVAGRHGFAMDVREAV
ncbi:MAG: hypothetical protein KAJ19_11035 [Gammaproteobacteria bacterium]|nr:hypothetical protein [Gammaproteobacteria bacterium]